MAFGPGSTPAHLASPSAGQHTVPVSPVGREAESLRAELNDAISRVIDSGRYILGPEVERFCNSFAAYCGVDHCVGVGNGTDALELALRGLGVGEGDEVITVANAGGYTTTACLAVGATPVYVDIEPTTHLIDIENVAGAISPATRAIVATHLYGAPVDIDDLREVVRVACTALGLDATRIAIIEDCAQAHGATLRGQRVGSLGDIACFSFFPTKNLGAIGDGGAVVCDSAELAERVASLAQYGWRERYLASDAGGRNSRLDELQAAVLNVKLAHLDEWNSRRAWIAGRYAAALGSNPNICLLHAALPDGIVGEKCAPRESVFHLGVLVADDRADLAAHLDRHGIAHAIHYPTPDHLQPAYAGRFRIADSLEFTERAAREVLSVGTHPSLTDDEVARVCVALMEYAQ